MKVKVLVTTSNAVEMATSLGDRVLSTCTQTYKFVFILCCIIWLVTSNKLDLVIYQNENFDLIGIKSLFD